MTHRLGFTGDVMLGRLVDDCQQSRPVTAVWGTMLDRLRDLDGLFINLECCLSTRGQPWQRTDRPFHFRADPDWAVRALKAAGVDYCSLANNHILDYEIPALHDTLDVLSEADIAYAGAGRNRDKALEPAFISIGDLTVAVVAFTDNTPEYAASEDSPGTARVEMDARNPTTRERVREALARATQSDSDLVIASLHWGPNMVEAPPGSFREFGRWLVDEGIDVVHGHSAHVFQGIEIHDDRPILYDTGDFVDDYAVDGELRNDRSFLFELQVTDAGVPQRLRLHPIVIYDCAVHKADHQASEWSRRRMRKLSIGFGTDFERDGDRLVCELRGQAGEQA